MSKDKVLKDYISFKRTSVKTENKLKDIERYTKLFLDSFKVSMDKVEEKDLVNFLNTASKKYSINSMNGIRAGLKNFIKWYYEDYPKRFRNLKRLCRTETAPSSYNPEQMLNEDDVKKIINGEKDFMWRVYWLVYFYGAFRPAEAIKLKWKDVTFEKDGTTTIHILSTKKNKKFTKDIPEKQTKIIKEWKELNNSEYLFPSNIKANSHMHPKSVYHRLKNLSEKVLNKRINPYILRHSYGTINYPKENVKDDVIAHQMGQSKSQKHVYMNLNTEGIKARASKIWSKPPKLKPEERDKVIKALKDMNERIKDLEEQVGVFLGDNNYKQIEVVVDDKTWIWKKEEK